MSTSISIFPYQPKDHKAYVFTPENFGADPTGKEDNTAAMQKAIDQLESEEKNGIIFIPSGTYCFKGTVNIWRGIRLIGFGSTRPVFTVPENTSYFQGPDSKYMFHFRVNKPGPGEELRDGQNTTFFSGIRNIDFRAGKGNPGLVACRFRVAQLCSIEDVDFHMADSRAAVEMIGNEMERCRFYGGQYGILTGETVPYWPFYLGDCYFSGQTRACISTYRAGMTMLRVVLSNAPYGVFVPNKEMDNHYIEEFERLYIHDCRLENLEVGISMNMIRYPQNWLHAKEVYCHNVPRFFESFGYQYNHHIGVPHIEPGMEYYSASIDMGLRIDVTGQDSSRFFDLLSDIRPQKHLPDVPGPDYVSMPDMPKWVNMKDLGARGDGVTDDTQVFRQAIEQHQVLYLPQGYYLISGRLELKKDTVIFGLHCSKTRLILKDHCPGFDDDKAPAAMVKIPEGGLNSISGICFNGGRNKGVIQVEWLGAPSSVMEDCLFDFGGHGDIRKGQDRYYGIYVHDGGAGVFKNIWMPDVWTKDGLHISNTSAPGQIWMISVEHHKDVEVVLENVANWKIIALQTEENLGSEYACSIRMENCRDLEFANLFQYRVQAIGIEHPNATVINNCRNLTMNGIHCFSIGPCPFSNSALIDGKLFIRDLEIGMLRINC